MRAVRQEVLRLTEIRGELGRPGYMAGAALTFALALGAWATLEHLRVVNPTFLPPLGRVARTLVEMATRGDLWSDTSVSLFRVTTGFLLAAALGVPLGILAGTFRLVEALVVPASEFVRYMPVPAFLPLVMVWFGVGEAAKVLVIFLGSFFQLVLMVAEDARRVPGDLLQVAYTLGANRVQAIRRVLLPAMLPALVDTLRLVLGWAWTYLVVAELVAANSGLGFRILKAQRFLNTDLVFVGILVVGLLGLASDQLLRRLNRAFFPWWEGNRR